MHEIELVLGPLLAVAALVWLSRKIDVPYPILLVIGGLVLGFVPGLPHVELEPELVFLLFLPPLLFSSAWYSSFRDLRFNTRPIAQRLGAPRRIVTVLEGESLINDATGLVAYRAAIAAALTGGFSLGDEGLRFVYVVVAGVAIGLIVGWAIAWLWRRMDDPPVSITISFLAPFAAYLPAEQVGASGVLATVTAGLYLPVVC